MGRGEFDGVTEGQWSVFAEKMMRERDEARETSESWRKACVAWQHWANDLLSDLGRQMLFGELGDRAAMDAIEKLALQAPAVPRCSCCGCFQTVHDFEVAEPEKRTACTECECQGYED